MKSKKIFLIILMFSLIHVNNYSSRFFERKKSEGQELLRTMILEDFETSNSWVVKYSRFRKHTWKETGVVKYEPSLKWMTWKKLDPKSEDYRYMARPEPLEMKGKLGVTIMGVRGKFYTKGYNWIAVEPKQDLYMMGKVRHIRVWVWGGNYDYDLYIVLKNYMNRLFKFKLANLKFIGWRQLSFDLRKVNIEITDVWAPQHKNLQFVRFLIVSKVTERPTMFGIWFDDLKYDTDLWDHLYPGKALENEFDWD